MEREGKGLIVLFLVLLLAIAAWFLVPVWKQRRDQRKQASNATKDDSKQDNLPQEVAVAPTLSMNASSDGAELTPGGSPLSKPRAIVVVAPTTTPPMKEDDDDEEETDLEGGVEAIEANIANQALHPPTAEAGIEAKVDAAPEKTAQVATQELEPPSIENVIETKTDANPPELALESLLPEPVIQVKTDTAEVNSPESPFVDVEAATSMGAETNRIANDSPFESGTVVDVDTSGGESEPGSSLVIIDDTQGRGAQISEVGNEPSPVAQRSTQTQGGEESEDRFAPISKEDGSETGAEMELLGYAQSPTPTDMLIETSLVGTQDLSGFLMSPGTTTTTTTTPGIGEKYFNFVGLETPKPPSVAEIPTTPTNLIETPDQASVSSVVSKFEKLSNVPLIPDKSMLASQPKRPVIPRTLDDDEKKEEVPEPTSEDFH